MTQDNVEHPKHYDGVHIEVIELTELFSFVLGNAIKYICRAGKKPGAPEVEDLKKASWYLRRALAVCPLPIVSDPDIKGRTEAKSIAYVFAMRYPLIKTLLHSSINSDCIAIEREDLTNTIKQISERVKLLEGNKNENA